MITPQQIEQISFGKQPFGGYDMEQVDEFLEPLTEDYITLYKENALLKSKMRVLVTKLEEYRQNEASLTEAITNAQQTCDMMVKEAEAKCTQMLSEANVAAAENTKTTDALIAEENARVDEARRTATAKIEAMEAQLRACLEELERIKTAERTVETKPVAYDYDSDPDKDVTVVNIVDEILSNLEVDEVSAPAVAQEETLQDEPMPPLFADLKFGPNYNPTEK